MSDHEVTEKHYEAAGVIVSLLNIYGTGIAGRAEVADVLARREARAHKADLADAVDLVLERWRELRLAEHSVQKYYQVPFLRSRLVLAMEDLKAVRGISPNSLGGLT